MFLRYILDQCDQSKADKLAIVCGLDINNLYQLAAHLKLEKGDVQQAARFFQQSKVSSSNQPIALWGNNANVRKRTVATSDTCAREKESANLEEAHRQVLGSLVQWSKRTSYSHTSGS